MVSEGQRQEWFEQLDNAVQAVLAEPRARQLQYVFQHWLERMFDKFGIGKGVTNHSPPNWLQSEASFQFVLNRLRDLRITVSDPTKVSISLIPYPLLPLLLTEKSIKCSPCSPGSLKDVTTTERINALKKTGLVNTQHEVMTKQKLISSTNMKLLVSNKHCRII